MECSDLYSFDNATTHHWVPYLVKSLATSAAFVGTFDSVAGR